MLNIDFSKNGEGAILITAIGNSLYLNRALVDNLKIGDIVSIDNLNFEELAKLNFYKTETIDIVMEKLIAIKNYLLLNSAS